MTRANILIVDDVLVNLKLLRAMLSPEGYGVHEALSGQEALEKLASVRPDIILLDIMMPEMDGLETCRRIKQNEDYRTVPVVMVTALQQMNYKAQAMEAGADDFLNKPIDRTELLVRVKSLLRIKGYSDELLKSYRALEEKNRELEKLERARDGLTNMIIHDLRGPLTSITMNMDMCLMKLENTSPLSRYIENASQQCLYLNDMIQGLLDVYRMEKEQLELCLEVVSPVALVNEAIDYLKPQIEKKGLEIDVHHAANLPDLLADSRLVKRIIGNILDNAIRHTAPGGGIRIKLNYHPKDDCITFSISDDGPGLDEKYHTRIFDKFEQVQLKKDGINRGSLGLGLAFCKMATELHGGRIWVESVEAGKGCCFSFTLPALPETTAEKTNDIH